MSKTSTLRTSQTEAKKNTSIKIYKRKQKTTLNHVFKLIAGAYLCSPWPWATNKALKGTATGIYVTSAQFLVRETSRCAVVCSHHVGIAEVPRSHAPRNRVLHGSVASPQCLPMSQFLLPRCVQRAAWWAAWWRGKVGGGAPCHPPPPSCGVWGLSVICMCLAFLFLDFSTPARL